MSSTLRLSLAALAISLLSAGAQADVSNLNTSSLSQDTAPDTVTYVDFWASWCKPCLKSFPWMNEMQARYADKGLKIIAVNVDSEVDDANAFLQKNPPAFAVKFDAKGETAGEFSVKAMPSSYLFDREGQLISSHLGFREADREEYEMRIRAALGLEGEEK